MIGVGGLTTMKFCPRQNSDYKLSSQKPSGFDWMILFQFNRFIILTFQPIGGIRTMNAAFFHGFIFPNMSFRKLAVLFNEHRQP